LTNLVQTPAPIEVNAFSSIAIMKELQIAQCQINFVKQNVIAILDFSVMIAPCPRANGLRESQQEK